MSTALIALQETGAAQAAARPSGLGAWPSLEARGRAYHEAAQAVICFLLYGDEVIREVVVQGRGLCEPGLSTFSRLPIPIVCRPPGGEPRRGNPAPVSADAIVDAHGVLQYAGGAAEALLTSWDAAPRVLASETAQQRQRCDREALSRLSGLVRSERPGDIFYDQYWEEAVRLLRANWVAVEALAEALQSRGSLSGARIDELLCSFLPS